jgi:hypothetical protein
VYLLPKCMLCVIICDMCDGAQVGLLSDRGIFLMVDLRK